MNMIIQYDVVYFIVRTITVGDRITITVGDIINHPLSTRERENIQIIPHLLVNIEFIQFIPDAT